MFVVQRIRAGAFRFANISKNVRFLSGKKDGKAPNEFYDDNLEEDKEFFDIVSSMSNDNKSLRSMSALHIPVKTWDHYTKAVSGEVETNVVTGLDDHTPEVQDASISNAIRSAIGVKTDEATVGQVEEDHFDRIFDNPSGENAVTSHFGSLLEENPYVPVQAMNYSKADYATADEESHNFLEKFVPSTAPEKFSMHSQGLRHCEGKKQRHGKSKELRCHLIDLDAVDAMDVVTLKRYVTDDGEIMGKRITGLCAKCQRAVARTVKNARNMGVMPHLGQFVLRDGKPQYKPIAYHDPVVVHVNNSVTGETKKRVERIVSKTIVP